MEYKSRIATLMKRKRIFVICMVITLTLFAWIELKSDPEDIASASSLEIAVPLITASEHPGQLPSPQPSWELLDFPKLPPPRIGSSVTLNPLNEIALLFGGLNSSTGELNDLWLTDGFDWIQFQTPHSPQERSNASMAYDEGRQVAILFGGGNNLTLFADTWLFNGVDWTQQQPLTSPSPRAGASLVYDADRNLIILFGGYAATGGKLDEALNEMWTWDGDNWQQVFPAILPPARWGASMVYDRAHKSIVLFGGAIEGGLREDTWLWDGTSWIEQHPLHHPTGRADFGMTYDESRQQVILFGGQTNVNTDPTETWSWDGQDWTRLPTSQKPPEELAYRAHLVYLPGLQRVVLYNAFRQKTLDPDEQIMFTERSEVWALTYQYKIYFPVTSR
jgi:hypothetical protein